MILKVALKAYQLLQEHYSLFQVRSTMVGLTGEGSIKVWHHTDYSEALPENVNCGSLSEMIGSIVAAVERSSSSPHSYPKFSEYMSNHRGTYPGFEPVQDLLTEYLEKYRIILRESLPRLG